MRLFFYRVVPRYNMPIGKLGSRRKLPAQSALAGFRRLDAADVANLRPTSRSFVIKPLRRSFILGNEATATQAAARDARIA